MSTNFARLVSFLGTLSVGVSLLYLRAEASSDGMPLLSVPSDRGSTHAVVVISAFPGFLGDPSHWTTYVHTAYFPQSGHTWTGNGSGWAGSAGDDKLALVDDSVIGMYYQRGTERLYVAMSTNKNEPGLSNITSLVQAHLTVFTNSPQRFLAQPPYSVKVETLLGSRVFRNIQDTNELGWVWFENRTHPSSFKGLTVEGTNAVATIQVSTNITARIAFNKSVIPVWATTNGVSIGLIPTNCVSYSEVISNKVVSRVVY